MKYPFQPEILDALPEGLTELFRALEITLLDEICSRLKLADQLNEVAVSDIRALRSHGIDLKDIEKAIRKTAGISEKKLKELLDDVVERNQKYYTDLIDLAHITQPDALVSIEDTWAIYEQTKQTMRNLTRSMGFLVDAGRTMLPPARAYRWALDSAVMQIQSGAISYNQAISNAVKQLADSGLKTVDYESGRRDQVDVAARRAVMTGVNALNQKYAEQSADYLETDLVEVSAHIGARNTGNGLENHESWQGGVYRWAEKPGDSKGEYKDFVATTGYGQGAGLGGWNCRHTFYPFVEGVSEPTYSQADLDAMKGENRKFVFDGKEYDGYTATQMQRSIERQIRKQKRLRDAYKAAGLKDDETAANIKLRRLNDKYKEFSKAAGLPEQKERLKVLYGGQLTNSKKFAPLKEYAGTWKIKDKFSDRQYVIDVGKPQISGAKQHFWDNLENRPDRSSLNLEAAQDIINNSRLTLYQTDRQTLKFLADNGYVMLNTKNEIVTVVPEKLRKKYRDYLEGK